MGVGKARRSQESEREINAAKGREDDVRVDTTNGWRLRKVEVINEGEPVMEK